MPVRRTDLLHRHRLSIADSIYFVTSVTAPRRGDLTNQVMARELIDIVRGSDGSQATRTIGFTVMPDHCHWLFQLGHTLALGRVMAKFKFHTRLILRQQALAWQRDFYEHRLKPGEDSEDYALYVFLNPYRAKLIQADQAWPWWWTSDPRILRFTALLNANGSPPGKWVGMPVPASIMHGE